jgi:hypothetical protein
MFSWFRFYNTSYASILLPVGFHCCVIQSKDGSTLISAQRLSLVSWVIKIKNRMPSGNEKMWAEDRKILEENHDSTSPFAFVRPFYYRYPKLSISGFEITVNVYMRFPVLV